MKTLTMTHEGRVALVTGAGQGVGRAIAIALADRGAKGIATNLDYPDQTVERMGMRGYGFRLDVTDEDHWQAIAAGARRIGDVDIVVNNAGYFPNRIIDGLDLKTWRKTMATNLDAHFLSAKYF